MSLARERHKSSETAETFLQLRQNKQQQAVVLLVRHKPRKIIHRVTTHLEKSGNSKVVTEKSGKMEKVREKSGSEIRCVLFQALNTPKLVFWTPHPLPPTVTTPTVK